MFRKYFPRGIAKGEAFFGREKELQRLARNIGNNTHTVLMAPRRYGKSSLAKAAVERSGLPAVEIDLFVALGDKDIGRKIFDGVSALIQKVAGKPENWFTALREFFNRCDKKWTVGIKGVQLELIPHNQKTVPQNILDVLEALEFILKEKETQAIIYIDEFQEISSTVMGRAIEGAIRHFAQECEHVVFIFSGSNRRMLKKIFENKSQPLYSLCDEIRLDRIDAVHYQRYLRKVSQETFGQPLSDEVIALILECSRRHPKYVYVLCDEIWFFCKKRTPQEIDVEIAWAWHCFEKWKTIRSELVTRTYVQRNLLSEIANGNNLHLSSKENLLKLELTSSAVVQALKTLEELDYIEQLDSGEYRIIDPFIEFAVSHSSSDKIRKITEKYMPVDD